MKHFIVVLVFFMGWVSISSATPVTFIYDSTTDASAIGGSATTAVHAKFTFDSNLANGTGSFGTSATNGSYGPWFGSLQIGSEVVSLTGGTIEVFNDAGTTIKNDSYDFRWSSSRGTSTGMIAGSDLDFFRILIVDDNLDMFSSVALPSDSSFALKGDYIQDDYQLTDFRSFGLSEFSPPGRNFSLSNSVPAPEPSTGLLLVLGLLGFSGPWRSKFRF